MFPLLWQYKDEVKTMAQAFFGGVHPNDMKAATNEKAIEQLAAPAEVVIPMSMHIGAPCKPIVAVGDKVTIGQKIGEPGGFVSAPIHASVSGTVKAVEPRPFSMGGTMMSVVIENDFQNTVCPDIHPVADPDSLMPEQLVEIVKNAGIVGQGGATFPTHVKISSGLGKVDYVIINAAECEPYITGDHRAMLERPAEIIGGCCYLAKMFGVSKGDTYDKKSMHKRLGIGKETDPEAMSVSSLYQNNGYLMSQIEPAETIIGPDSIDIEVKVFEGKQFQINEVGITGNQRVDDEVIRRELRTFPGELYDRSLLMQTIRTLGSMGHFNPETIMPDIKPVSDRLVNVNWPLEEQASDQFNIAGGWGSGTFVGSVGITLNNLSVKNFFKKGAWRPYPMGQNQRLSVSAQTNGTYYKAFALSFTDPWLGGKKPNSFTISAHFSEQNNAYYVWQKSTQYFRTYGVAAGLGKRLNWPDPYFTLYGEASYERFSLKNWNTFGMTNGAANLLSLKLVFARNSVDQPIYPRRGSEFSASVQFTPPYSLWDGKDYKKLEQLANSTNSTTADKANQERYRWVEFHKWQFKAQWFQALTKNSNLVLMLKAEMGYLGNYNKHKVSPFERFEVGGDGMSGYNIYGIDIISMRGYEDGALDPTSDYSVGYNKYTAELRYPVILKPSSQIYVLGFLEGGNAFESWKKFSPFKIKRSAGFGVRLYLPVVGMLGIDWGYGFDAPAGSTKKSGSQFHFVLGQQF